MGGNTRELIRRFDEGRLLVIYWGHGGPNLWSHERLFHLSDLRQLRPTSHIPFVACASCDNAWLDYPIPPVHFSMGELLVKQPNGGAIGVFAPVSGATPYEHQTLMTRLVEGLFRRNVRRLGEATLYAKNQYYGQTFAASIPQQYVLVGDPAVKLKLPKTMDSWCSILLRWRRIVQLLSVFRLQVFPRKLRHPSRFTSTPSRTGILCSRDPWR